MDSLGKNFEIHVLSILKQVKKTMYKDERISENCITTWGVMRKVL